MYILMISRGIPSKENPQWGCFEKDQAEALAKLGHKVVVLSIDARFEKKRGSLGLHRLSINGVEYYNYVMLPGTLISKIFGYDLYLSKFKFGRFYRVFKIIEKKHGRPEVIYSHFFWNTSLAVKLKAKIDVPVVAIEHLARFNEDKLSVKDEKWADFAFTGCDALIAVSNSLAINLKRRFGKSCTVVHNMYGSEFGVMGKMKTYKKSDPVIFVSAASLVYRKGFDVLIKAFAKANIPKNRWVLNIIGWGEEKANLEQLIKDNDLEANVNLLGKKGKNEIARELRKSDVFVLPSRNENFSVSVLEALSVGLPVLATDCGGIRECISENNGIIVPVDDILSMANALEDFVENIHTYNREEIAKDCAKKFSNKAIGELLTSVFQNVVGTYCRNAKK